MSKRWKLRLGFYMSQYGKEQHLEYFKQKIERDFPLHSYFKDLRGSDRAALMA